MLLGCVIRPIDNQVAIVNAHRFNGRAPCGCRLTECHPIHRFWCNIALAFYCHLTHQRQVSVERVLNGYAILWETTDGWARTRTARHPACHQSIPRHDVIGTIGHPAVGDKGAINAHKLKICQACAPQWTDALWVLTKEDRAEACHPARKQILPHHIGTH